MKTLVPALFLLAIPAAAFAEISVGDALGVDDAALIDRLEAEGYTVAEIEREDDEIEIEVTRDGVEYEIELDAMGVVLEIEQDD